MLEILYSVQFIDIPNWKKYSFVYLNNFIKKFNVYIIVPIGTNNYNWLLYIIYNHYGVNIYLSVGTILLTYLIPIIL